MAKGTLPWMQADRLKPAQIAKMKENADGVELCKDLPPAFNTVWDYIKQMKFNQVPDYRTLYDSFKHSMTGSSPNMRQFKRNFSMTRIGGS